MRRAWAGLAVLLLASSLALTLLRFVATPSRWPSMLASFSSYAVVGYLLALVLLVVLLLRRRVGVRWSLVGVAVAVAGLVLHAVWLAPLFTGTTGHRVDLTVMNANLEFGEADASTVVEAVANRHVDVLVVEEMTPKALLGGFASAGLTRLLPYVAGSPDYSAAGTMVFSRFPLTDATRLPISNGGLAVTVAAPTPFRLLAVHPSQPLSAAPTWLGDLRRLRAAATAAVATGPTLVVGDLNATPDHQPFRRVLGVGLRDAAEQANAGWQPTWPHSTRLPVPRVITIDHVLASRQMLAVRTSTVDVPGTDHRALVAQLQLR